MRPLFLSLFAALALFTTGCLGPHLSDDIDFKFDFAPTLGDELNMPYVTGAKVHLFARDAGNGAVSSVVIQSSNPKVFRVDAVAGGGADCTALEQGEAEVSIVQGGSVLHTSTIVVRKPTHALAIPRGDLMTQEGFAVPVDEVQVLLEGTATFEIQYFEGDTPLHGNGALTAKPSGHLTATTVTTSLFEKREWLQVTPSEALGETIELDVGGEPVGALVVDGVTKSAIARVGIHGESEIVAKDGQQLALLGESFDEKGRRVLGVDYVWDVNGVPQSGAGDLFLYQFQASSPAQVTVGLDGRTSTVSVHEKPGSGEVSSTNKLGCSASGRGPEASTLALLALAAIAIRRRRSCRA